MKRIFDQQIAGAEQITGSARRIGLPAGPLAFVLILLVAHPASMTAPAVSVLAITAWIAIWWVTEAVPLPVTSLLPIILFPLFGILKLGATTSSYADPIVFLYIGGFLIAIAIEKTGLHKRIAMTIIRSMGTQLKMIVLGFMISTAFISMWISNTATAIMMLPIGLAIITATTDEIVSKNDHFKKSLMLAIAYAASIGGLATIIGTPPNLVYAGVMRDMYQMDIGFMEWFVIAFPVTVILLLVSWLYLVRIGFPLGNARLSGGREALDSRLAIVGRMGLGEKLVATVFLVVAISWILRSFVLQKLIPGLDDTVIAVLGGVVLFLLPSGNKDGKRLMSWEDANRLPWGIVLLFGGGLALAEAFEVSGLAQWIGEHLSGFAGWSTVFLLLMVVAIVNLLTEFTSNLATVTMILPVLAPVAISADVPPQFLMIGATLAASCGFMMPAGTPPNAIAFGSGYLSIWDMVKTGFWLNLASVIVITVVVMVLGG